MNLDNTIKTKIPLKFDYFILILLPYWYSPQMFCGITPPYHHVITLIIRTFCLYFLYCFKMILPLINTKNFLKTRMSYTQNLSSGDQSHVIKSCNVRKIFGTIYIIYFYPFLIYLYLAYLNIVLWSVLLCDCSYGEKRKLLYSEKILFFSDKYFHIQRKI